MLDHQHGQAAVAQPDQVLGDGRPQAGADPGKRLVQQQHPRRGHQRPHDLDQSLLPATLGPISPVIVPGATANAAPSTAWTPANSTRRPVTSTMAGSVTGPDAAPPFALTGVPPAPAPQPLAPHCHAPKPPGAGDARAQVPRGATTGMPGSALPAA